MLKYYNILFFFIISYHVNVLFCSTRHSVLHWRKDLRRFPITSTQWPGSLASEASSGRSRPNLPPSRTLIRTSVQLWKHLEWHFKNSPRSIVFIQLGLFILFFYIIWNGSGINWFDWRVAPPTQLQAPELRRCFYSADCIINNCGGWYIHTFDSITEWLQQDNLMQE